MVILANLPITGTHKVIRLLYTFQIKCKLPVKMIARRGVGSNLGFAFMFYIIGNRFLILCQIAFDYEVGHQVYFKHILFAGKQTTGRVSQ